MPEASSFSDAMSKLAVIQRLQVGPVQVTARRLVAPYTVHQASGTETFEFTYRFEEDVFDPADPLSQNLAGMMASQVALNYGLFCNEIVIVGHFDDTDRRFLRMMAENTAREIYVKKLLQPNEFLRETAQGMPVERRDTYLQATLVFPETPPSIASDRSKPWSADTAQVAVLSSGGKESLLGESLLREIGYETHPLFVNESGRHWFTALNAYRSFMVHRRNTARVWCNSDRLFTWMLRRLPFVREDFARVRSDTYPVRLWTVAVFLFGVLPLLRKRKIGRLVIGDEYDTTVRKSFQGIRHYDGLYDQSRHFDSACTRYFHRKGWGVDQFSILRPLSELLVEKVLVERYPEVQRLQVSCHAAHTDGDRVRPCGKCDKCARVVGMLVALGADPCECSYTDAQAKQALENLTARGASLEPQVVEHLAYLLTQHGLLASGRLGRTKARVQTDVVKLRFDRQRSPMDDIPRDIRQPLYRTLLEHCDGAVQRIGKMWVDFDPLADPAIHRPYPFETPATSHRPGTQPDTGGRGFVLGELTWPEAQRRLQETDLALLPVGAIEQHGPHLPLDTDAFDADYLCRAVAERCTDPKPLILPLVPYGVSYHHDDFAGTISIDPKTLSGLIHEIGLAVARHGITKLVIVNGHGGNAPALHFAAQLINRDAHIFTCVDTGETSDVDINALADTPNDVHAGEIETSTSLALRPELVHMDQACKFVPASSSRYLDFNSKRSVEWYAHVAKISSSGVLGDPTAATREKGLKMWELMIEHLLGLIEDLKSLSLDDIHQRRRQ